MVELVYSNYLTYKIVKSLDYCGDIGSLALTEMAIFGQKMAFNHPRRGKKGDHGTEPRGQIYVPVSY